MCVTSINETILLIPLNNITTYEGDSTLRRASKNEDGFHAVQSVHNTVARKL
jgi:hypothetical protein